MSAPPCEPAKHADSGSAAGNAAVASGTKMLLGVAGAKQQQRRQRQQLQQQQQQQSQKKRHLGGLLEVVDQHLMFLAEHL